MDTEIPSPSRLHGLPRELRDLIYSFAVVSSVTIRLYALNRNADQFLPDPKSPEESGWSIVTSQHYGPGHEDLELSLSTWLSLSRVDKQTRKEADEVFFEHLKVDIRETTGCHGLLQRPRLRMTTLSKVRFVSVEKNSGKLLIKSDYYYGQPFVEQKLVISPSLTAAGKSILEWEFKVWPYEDDSLLGTVSVNSQRVDVDVAEHLGLLHKRVEDLAGRASKTCQLRGQALYRILDLLTAPEQMDVGCKMLGERSIKE